jgi:hypothetical protein
MVKVRISNDFCKRISRYIRFDSVGQPIGREGQIRINYFLDFLSAVHNASFCSYLSKHFAEFRGRKPDLF